MTQREQASKLIYDIRRELVQGYGFLDATLDRLLAAGKEPPYAEGEWRYPEEGIKNLTDALAALQRQPGRQ
jgi:hypothetical protein